MSITSRFLMSCPHKSTPDFAIRGRLHRHLWFGGLLPMYIYPFGCPLKSTPDFPMCRRFHRHLWLWGLLPTYMCDKYSYHSRPLVAHSAPLQLQINLHLNHESPTGPNLLPTGEQYVVCSMSMLWQHWCMRCFCCWCWMCGSSRLGNKYVW